MALGSILGAVAGSAASFGLSKLFGGGGDTDKLLKKAAKSSKIDAPQIATAPSIGAPSFDLGQLPTISRPTISAERIDFGSGLPRITTPTISAPRGDFGPFPTITTPQITAPAITALPGVSMGEIRAAVPTLDQLTDRTPVGFSTPGLTGLIGPGGDVSLSRTPELSGIMQGLLGTGTEAADDLSGLIAGLKPGFGKVTESRVAAIQNARQKAIGNLGDDFARRGIAGSSFAKDKVIGAEREFAQAEAEARAQSFLEEVDVTGKLIDQRFQVRSDTMKTALTQLQSESNIGVDLVNQSIDANEKSRTVLLELGLEVAKLKQTGQFAKADAELKTRLANADNSLRAQALTVDVAKLMQEGKVANLNAEMQTLLANAEASLKAQGLNVNVAELAQKGNIANLNAEMQARVLNADASLKAQGLSLDAVLKSEIAKLSAASQTGIANLDAQLRVALANQQADLEAKLGSAKTATETAKLLAEAEKGKGAFFGGLEQPISGAIGTEVSKLFEPKAA